MIQQKVENMYGFGCSKKPWLRATVLLLIAAIIVTIFLIGCWTCWNVARGAGVAATLTDSGAARQDPKTLTKLHDRAIAEHLRELSSKMVEQKLSKGEDASFDNDLDDLPVDLVYTWVDCKDAKWSAKKREAYRKFRMERGERQYEVTVADDDRFSSQLDELRFSMQSVEAYMPWVRKVFLVTDGQTPAWLDEFRNKTKLHITVVDHHDIFPKPSELFLPTFNSVAIETCLHRIPELSECYVYMNDDLFLCSPVKKSDYFIKSDDGNTIGLHYHVDFMQMMPSREVKLTQMPPSLFQLAQINTLKMLQGDQGARLVVGLSHTPSPALKSFVEHIEGEIPKTVDLNRRLKFRGMEMINFTNNLVPNLALHRKKVFRITWSPYNEDLKQSALRVVENLSSGSPTILRTDNLKLGLPVSHYWESTDLCQLLDKFVSTDAVKQYAQEMMRRQPLLKFFVVNNSPGNYSVNQLNRFNTFLETMIRTSSMSA